MSRALKPPQLKLSLPSKPGLPKLPDPSQPDVFEEMTLLEHMTELRDRVIKIVLAVAVAFIGGIFLSAPMLQRLKETSNAVGGFDVVSPTDPITMYFKVALYIAIGVALPAILWQMFGFLAPGLTRKEKRILISSLPFVTVLFLGGAAYAFFVAAPKALTFLSEFLPDLFEWSPEGHEVVSFYLTLMVGLALAFQLPIVMFLLAKLGLVTPRKMRDFRKYAILLIAVAAAIITPSTDPFNMAMVALPLWALYELGILVAYVFGRSIKPALV
ncbi:MAG: twin-arginine translocase subunit TatC [Thermomicrobiales bacterium]|nr:twin-arginine translocase subunit TatC [Thermomicrobiales bacterium]